MCRKAHSGAARVLLPTPVLGFFWPGILLILHMPLIIPLPLFVLSQNCRTAAWHWFGYMPPRSVRCGALLFGNVWQAPIYFYCFILPARKRALSFISFFYSPLVYNVR